MDFGFTEEQTLLRDSVRKLMDRHATRDYIRKLDRGQLYPYELYDAWVEAGDRKSTRLNSSHIQKSRMPSSA